MEDEPDLLRGLLQGLREAGYAVDAAEDGEEGLHKAEATDYDAIVLDVMLPVLDGFEVLRRLRRTKRTPVLILTARTEFSDRVRGLDTGADDYLAKPFDLDELLARLRALIRRASSDFNCSHITKPVSDDYRSCRMKLIARAPQAVLEDVHLPIGAPSPRRREAL